MAQTLCDQRDANQLNGRKNEALDKPRCQQRPVRRPVENRNPERIEKQTENQLVDADSGDDPGPALFLIQEKAVNTAGQEGRQRKTGEIGPDGEQKGAEKVAEQVAEEIGKMVEETAGTTPTEE